MRGASRPGVRSAAAVAGLLALVALVAAAAAGHAPAGGESRSADPPKLVADYLASTMLVLMALGAPLLVFALVVRRASQAKAGARGRTHRWVVGIAALAAILIAVTHSPLRDWFGRNEPHGKAAKPAKVKSQKEKEPAPKPVSSYEPKFRWVPAFVVGSLILGIGGAIAVLALRRRRELLSESPAGLALSEVLAETIDDLRREADPRRAVIRAYARMERTLAARGLPRRETEAPLEYLARVLDAVQASAHSVDRLTQLFQRARFSTHEIDAGMKRDAIEALSGLRAELEVAR